MEIQRLRRLLQMLAILPREPQSNQISLARDFGVDERTIRRDTAVLVEAGLATSAKGALWLSNEQALVVDRLVLLIAPGSSLARARVPSRAHVLL